MTDIQQIPTIDRHQIREVAGEAEMIARQNGYSEPEIKISGAVAIGTLVSSIYDSRFPRR